MFQFAKIQAFLNTSILLQNVPIDFTFIYNEDVIDVQNLHGRYWERNEVEISNNFVSGLMKAAVS